MEYSVAHDGGMNLVGVGMFPDGKVPWEDAQAPDIEKGERYWTGRLRSCGYCGSMHPKDVVAAIQAGAMGEWADWKYGWPHKAYFENIPNPHAGLLEVRSSANYLPDGKKDWVFDGGHWHEPGAPATEKTGGKFYSIHLKDANAEEIFIIENHLGVHFEFLPSGQVHFKKAGE